MKKAVYPGSFDPLTKGHLDIIERASNVFDEVVVAIMEHPSKKTLCSTDIRKGCIEKNTAHLDNVSVVVGEGLTIELAKTLGASVLIRGVRSIKDFEYEEEMANANRYVDPTIDTVLFFTSPKYSFISSSLIKEMARHGKDVSDFVPEDVSERLIKMGDKHES